MLSGMPKTPGGAVREVVPRHKALKSHREVEFGRAGL